MSVVRPLAAPLANAIAGALTYLFGGASPLSLFSAGEQGVWYDFDDDMDAKIAYRRNVTYQTENLSNNTYWAKYGTTITTNAATAPDGSLTADKIVESAISEAHMVRANSVPDLNGTASVMSVYAKMDGRRYISLTSAGGDLYQSTYDLQLGVVTTTNDANKTGSIVDVGNGWFRCINYVPAGVFFMGVGLKQAGTGGSEPIYTGDGTSGVLVWGMQTEKGSVATTYQKVTDWNTEFLAQFPNHTLYQDSNGTTAMTAPEQPLGLVLDKSKGLVLGAEVITNGTFDTDTGWTKSNATIAGGVVDCNSLTAFVVYVRQTMATPLPAGTYLVTATVSDYVSGSAIAGVTVGAAGSVNITGNGTFTGRFTLTSTAFDAWIQGGGSGFVGKVDNLSIKRIAGNHATQATTSLKPKWSARKNLLTYTEDSSNGVWSKSSCTTANSSGTAPDNTNTAILVTGTGAAGYRINFAVSGSSSSASYRYSVYLKAGTLSDIRLGDANSGELGNFNLSAGTCSGATATIESVGNGWYRCSVTYTGTSPQLAIFYGAWAGGSSTGTYYLWHPQAEYGSVATAYQSVNTATDYNAIGFTKHAKSDGVDDVLPSSSIDLTGTNKLSFFAGVTKFVSGNSTIASSHTTEPATTPSYVFWSGNNGVVASGYGFRAKGATASNSNAYTATSGSVAVGSTDVLTGISDIADKNKLRVDAVAQTDSTVALGTGNFASTPLYMFSGVGNGELGISQIILLGRTASASDTTNTERFIANKTGVTL